MIRKKLKRIDLSSLFPLLMFMLFGVCVIIVLLLGVRTYRNQLQRDREDYEHRTAVLYLTTRLRQNDNTEPWSIGTFEDQTSSTEGDTLFFYETIGDVLYCTRIYCYDGYLYELFSVADDASFSREDGQKLLAVHSLRFVQKENGLCAVMEWEDASRKELYLFRRSNQGETP